MSAVDLGLAFIAELGIKVREQLAPQVDPVCEKRRKADNIRGLNRPPQMTVHLGDVD
jgi:hypothetical protein